MGVVEKTTNKFRDFLVEKLDGPENLNFIQKIPGKSSWKNSETIQNENEIVDT